MAKITKTRFFTNDGYKKLGQEKLKPINWNNTRIICIAESYSKHDIDMLEVFPLKLELYTYRYYDDCIFSIEQINGDDKKLQNKDHSETALKTPVEEGLSELAEKNIEEYDLKKQLEKVPLKIEELFWFLRKIILELDKIVKVKVNTQNIAFSISTRFAETHLQKENILIYLRGVKHDYPSDIVFPLKPGWGKINVGVRVRNMREVNEIMPLVEKSYLDVL